MASALEIEEIPLSLSQVHVEVLRPWIAKKVTQYVGQEDDIVISMVMAELDKADVDPRKMQVHTISTFPQFPWCMPARAGRSRAPLALEHPLPPSTQTRTRHLTRGDAEIIHVLCTRQDVCTPSFAFHRIFPSSTLVSS